MITDSFVYGMITGLLLMGVIMLIQQGLQGRRNMRLLEEYFEMLRGQENEKKKRERL